ncbi:hypothetical protein [Mycobacterium sp. 155]|uniref:hypothetical protein n=1 Tax=Mycobacterium sp. 155 TaxID=1157943 RepID=UPI00036647CE|nr:hypothetical protein [Mycobacterium sp. 155]
MPELRTIRGVQIAKAGTWEISTGEWTVTASDLAAAVDAHKAGVLRRPVLKIGHSDPRFDGTPALGRLDNLRLVDGGNTLVCDLIDVPRAVAALLPHAYPDRSVEALTDYTAPDGKVWPLVVTGLALLGETAPGIDNLAAITDLYGVAASKRVFAAASLFDTDNSSTRHRAVQVAAARRRRTHRTLTRTEG